jgi:hypothetical protein
VRESPAAIQTCRHSGKKPESRESDVGYADTLKSFDAAPAPRAGYFLVATRK